MHGGRVWVEDRPDGEPGARFVIELPAASRCDRRRRRRAERAVDRRDGAASARGAARRRRRWSCAGCAIQPDSGAARHPRRPSRAPLDPADVEARRSDRRRAGSSSSTSARRRAAACCDRCPRDVRRRTRSSVHRGRCSLGPNQRRARRRAAHRAAGRRSTLQLGAATVAARSRRRVRRVSSSCPASACGYAVAQIVFTASELDGCRRCVIRSTARRRRGPTADGELQSEPLTVYDYPGLAESAQPAVPGAVRTPTNRGYDRELLRRRDRHRRHHHPYDRSHAPDRLGRGRCRVGGRRARAGQRSLRANGSGEEDLGDVVEQRMSTGGSCRRRARAAPARSRRRERPPSGPTPPSCTRSIAATPNRVDSTRSNAVGVPPRWTWPSITTRVSNPVRSPISRAIDVGDAAEAHVAELVVARFSATSSVPGIGSAPSATTTIEA